MGAISLTGIAPVGIDILKMKFYYLHVPALPGKFSVGRDDYTDAFSIGVKGGRPRQVVAEGELEVNDQFL